MCIRRSFQKKCTLWQHRLINGAIGPANSAVVLEDVWKLVQCVSPPGSVCTSKRQSVEIKAIHVPGTVTSDDQRNITRENSNGDPQFADGSVWC